MYCLVYEFQVRPGENASFERAWADYTEAIYRVKGSLGSRLHKTTDPLCYVAYAQWPSKDSFERTVSDDRYTEEELRARDKMRASVLSSKTVYALEVFDDHLRTGKIE